MKVLILGAGGLTGRYLTKEAKRRGMEVVAGGIGRADQLAGLRMRGCDAGQGFLFSPAADADALRTLLAADRRW